MDAVIQNGTVVTASDMFLADVATRDGKITAIADRIKAPPDVRVIDARGMLVMPGGVDVHTHLQTPGLLADTADDFFTGTVAAAHGGTTSIVNFCPQVRGQGLLASLAEHRRLADPKAVIDFALHSIVADPSENTLSELGALPAEGVTSFKLFMAYKGDTMVDDGTMIRVFDEAARRGVVVMVHAENGDAVEFLRDRFAAEGKFSPRYHALSRPPRVEAEATNRAIALAEIAGAPLYIVHVSCAEALEEVRRGRARNVNVRAETCSHYLHITEEVFDQPGFEGGKYIYTPPPRAVGQPHILWEALKCGDLQVVSSDHGPFMFKGGKDIGKDDFRLIPNGAPGIEERMALVWQGVVRGLLTPSRFVDIVSTTPAKLFGLYPAKGTIAIGTDADIVVWDPAIEHRLSVESLHSAVDYTMYEGKLIRGGVHTVLSRGDVIIENGMFRGAPGRGRYIMRQPASRGAASG
ncbi:dihydropyrimidinase [Ochrobactrum soli]|uniref:Dihydropyrimidinase n=1 Tax=Ochrobactrum soli TaxID=2448455 RepID=A0A2P9HBE6_9HYPH|nr:dihydropyrimidinase [[Ochrobactrum] soli]SPL61416.1 Dihydropyrimidinase [[Ochrobactrum] soli]